MPRAKRTALFFTEQQGNHRPDQADILLRSAHGKQLRWTQQDKELSYSRRDTARVLDRTGGDECGGRRFKAKIPQVPAD